MSPEERALALIRMGRNMPTLDQIRAERHRRKLVASLKDFVIEAWPFIDPEPLVWGKHLDGVCACLQAIAEKKIKNLLINIPPGHAKSMIVSVLYPAWRWARDPSWSSIHASYEMRLVMRDAVKARHLIESDWYKETFRMGSRPWDLQDDQNTKQVYVNTAGGMRQGTSVGQGTGYRGNALVVDDPVSVDQSYSEVELATANRWFFETMPTRFNDMANAERVLMMQRLHTSDPSGEVLRREGEDWQHLCLPAEYDPALRSVVRAFDGTIIFEDWRTKPGELLFPEKFPAKVIATLKKSLGPYGTSGQLNQRPSPMGGGVLKKAYFNRRWTLPGKTVRPGVDPDCGVELIGKVIPIPIPRTFLITDAAFKGEKDSDRVAVGAWCLIYPNLYLLDLIWDQLDFGETLKAIRMLNAKWNPIEILVEDKANGSAIINTLQTELTGVTPIDPGTTSKHARILAGLPFLAAGNVWYPAEPAFTPSPRGNIATVSALIAEAAAFPKGANDDGIDMQAYAINKYLADGELAGVLAMGGSLGAGGMRENDLPDLSELTRLV